MATPPDGGGWVYTWVAILVPLGIVLLGAWHDRWVQEDAFINFRIIGNLLAGHGPVFNAGERVEAYSDPLWLFTLAGVHEIVRFLTLSWLSVVLGLLLTGSGVVLAGRAVQRLVSARENPVVLPLGLLVFSVVAGVWEFATSGLEMGMVFAWIGLSFWLLVRVEERRRSAALCAFVLGLGTLIRPELVLMSIALLGALAVVVSARGWHGPTSIGGRYVVPLLAAVALPVAYQLWRMAYFALLVPNTALAKSAAGSWWSQGFIYLWNFVAPYTLWLPLGLGILLIAPRATRWWRAGDRVASSVLLAPVVASLLDALYIVRIGGDYQHARLLLPSFLSLCIPLAVTTRQLRSLAVVPIVGIVIWAAVCGGWLRFSTHSYLQTDHGIGDERAIWVAVTKNGHPIDAANYGSRAGTAISGIAAALRARHQQAILVNVFPSPSIPTRSELHAARTSLPVSLVTNIGAIGVAGYLSGPNVYIFDEFSLANPIGSHFPAVSSRRPGQQKYIGPAWMVARFAATTTMPPPGTDRHEILAARSALACGTLHAYLRAITGPFDLSTALSDMAHAFTFTKLTVPSNPSAADRELCR